MITVRPYITDDFEQVKEVLVEAKMYDEVWDGAENLESMVDKDEESVLVAVDKEEVIGVIFLTTRGKNIVLLYRLVVKKERREEGVGSTLLKYAEEIAKQKGAKSIGMFVEEHETALIKYYKKRGYNYRDVKYRALLKELQSAR